MARKLLEKIKKKNIPNSYYFVIALAAVSVVAVLYAVTYSGTGSEEEDGGAGQPELSYISLKTQRLAIDMSRDEVIRLMGLPDWAVTWNPRADVSTVAADIALELYWKNPQCRPVTVMFSPEQRVIGWDDGTGACRTPGLTEEELAPHRCTRAEMARHCR